MKFEQEEIGNPEYGCTLPPIDFVAFARACGADGFHCERPDEIRPTIQAALRSPRAAVVEAPVDADEKPARPDAQGVSALTQREPFQAGDPHKRRYARRTETDALRWLTVCINRCECPFSDIDLRNRLATDTNGLSVWR